MYKAGHQKVRCPHCETEDMNKLVDFEYVKEQQKWMDSVIDVPKADRKSIKMVIKSIKQMKEYNEEYQSLKPSMEWVKNIDSFNKKQNISKMNDKDAPKKWIEDVKESLLEGER